MAEQVAWKRRASAQYDAWVDQKAANEAAADARIVELVKTHFTTTHGETLTTLPARVSSDGGNWVYEYEQPSVEC